MHFTFDLFKAAFLGDTLNGRRRRPVSLSKMHLHINKKYFNFSSVILYLKKQAAWQMHGTEMFLTTLTMFYLV